LTPTAQPRSPALIESRAGDWLWKHPGDLSDLSSTQRECSSWPNLEIIDEAITGVIYFQE
jgi:hypothetical protein